MNNSTRTYLEVKVGKTHVVEVLVMIRRAEKNWWINNNHILKAELFQLLSSTILPREFENELEEYHEEHHGRVRLPTDDGGIAVKNQKKGKKNQKKGKKTTKRGGGAKKKSTTSTVTTKEKSKREIRHAFGESIQMTYRMEDLPTTRNQSATLLFPRKQATEDSGSGAPTKFRLLPKLSKRVVLWCYPYDKNNPAAPVELAESGGFPRPELVPITSLFRAPRDLQDD